MIAQYQKRGIRKWWHGLINWRGQKQRYYAYWYSDTNTASGGGDNRKPKPKRYVR